MKISDLSYALYQYFDLATLKLLHIVNSLLMFLRSGVLVTFISGMPSSAEIIRAMDEISNTVSLSLSLPTLTCKRGSTQV